MNQLSPSSQHIHRFFLFTLAFVLFANFTVISPYLLALFLGWLLATVLESTKERLMRHRVRHRPASLIATLIATFAIILPVCALGFVTVKELVRAITKYSKEGLDIERWVTKIGSNMFGRRLFQDSDEIRGFVTDASKSVGESGLGLVARFVSSLPEIVLQLVLALLTCYFVLIQGRQLANWLGPRIPLTKETKSKLACVLTDIAHSSFLSMLIASLVQAAIVFTGFIILGAPMPWLALGLAFVFAWFPIFGVTPVWLAGSLYFLLTDRPGLGIAMFGFGVLASLSDNIVRPWVLKGRSDVHPLVSLFSIFGAIYFFGILGVLVGPVLAACLIELLEQWPDFAKELGLSPPDEPLKKEKA